MIRFGIVSFAHMHADGYMAAIQLLQAQGRAQLVAVADPDQQRGRSKAKAAGIESVFASCKEMLSSGSVDAIVITSENCHHLEQVLQAVSQGIHVLCEKPIGICADDLTKMRAAINGASKPIVFQTAFVCRFSPSIVEAKNAIDSGKLGRIKAISATNHGRYPGGWFGDKKRSGGGAIMDHTVHAADVIRFLTGDEFGLVRAFQGVNIRPDIAVEDNALIYSRLQNTDVPVSIDCSWSRHDNWPTWGDLTLNLYCQQGVIKIDAFKPHIEVSSSTGLEWHGLGEDLNEKLLRSFCCAIEELRGEPASRGDAQTALDKHLRAGFEDGARAAAVAISAYDSIAHQSEPLLLV